MQKRGAVGLKTLLLLFEETLCWTPAARSLLQSLGAATELQTLDISADYSMAVLDAPLPPLTQLTNLSIVSIRMTPAVASSILSLRSLTSLSVRYVDVHGDDFRGYWSPVLEQMATRLVRLSRLDLAVSRISAEGLAHLRALPQLKQLS